MSTRDLIAEMTENVNKYGRETITTYLMVQAIKELSRLQSENEALRAHVARSDTPTGLQPAAILPAFLGLAKRKLDELLAQGFQVNGLQIERNVDGAEPVRGFITVGGLVGWWNPDTQAERDRLREQVETTLTMVEQSNKISAELLRERDDLRAQVEALTRGGMSDQMRTFIEGMSVSVDVSTGDHDEGHRYFGTVTEVMDAPDDKHGVTLLVQDAEPNFTAPAPTRPAQAPEGVARPMPTPAILTAPPCAEDRRHEGDCK